VIFRDRLYDDAFVKQFTDLPLLVRLDTLKKLRATDVKDAPPLATLTNFTRVMAKGETPPPLEELKNVDGRARRQEFRDCIRALTDRRESAVQPEQPGFSSRILTNAATSHSTAGLTISSALSSQSRPGRCRVFPGHRRT
jgi:hypothetical protein